MALRSLALLLTIPAFAGCVGAASTDHAGWYEARSVKPPAGGRVFICHAFGCSRVTPVQLSPADLKRIEAPILAGRGSPETERMGIATAVATFEAIVGERVGTSGDLGGLQPLAGGDPTQMDCIDEATNTTSLLLVLEARGSLQHHVVNEPVSRGFLLDGRYPHATAVVAEKAGGTRWAVDSWPEKNGEPPVIQRLDIWASARGSGVGS